MAVVMRVFFVIAVSWMLASPGWAGFLAPDRSGMNLRGVAGGVADSPPGEDGGATFPAAMRAIVSALIGEAVSRTMDDADLMMTVLTLENAGAGASSRWRNPYTGNVYSITSSRTYNESGMPCLDYSMESVRGGRRDHFHGTACRQPDGRWTR